MTDFMNSYVFCPEFPGWKFLRKEFGQGYNYDIHVEKAKNTCKGLSGSKNIKFSDFVSLVEGFGFVLSRVSGSHHIFVHKIVREWVNLQEVSGQVKPYQVKQFMNIVERYDLKLEEE